MRRLAELETPQDKGQRVVKSAGGVATASAIVAGICGMAIGGPVGAVVGAVVGGLVGAALDKNRVHDNADR
jgi:hypothetical protein